MRLRASGVIPQRTTVHLLPLPAPLRSGWNVRSLLKTASPARMRPCMAGCSCRVMF